MATILIRKLVPEDDLEIWLPLAPGARPRYGEGRCPWQACTKGARLGYAEGNCPRQAGTEAPDPGMRSPFFHCGPGGEGVPIRFINKTINQKIKP